LETSKCVPKKSFKIKILKDDVNNDDPEVQFIGKGSTKVAEYESQKLTNVVGLQRPS
jgi:hypothetical protein